MSERFTKAKSIVLLSIILGAAGLSFGSISTVTLLTLPEEECSPGDEGQECISDNAMYLCSSEADLLAAINDIGTGDGYIWIMQDITLSAMVGLNSGGGITIQGINSSITIDVNGDYNGFNVSEVKSCTIRDLTIDISDLATSTLSAIKVAEMNDNLVQIQNIRILGDTSYNGRGISVQSNNVTVEYCYISQVDCGIYVDNGVSNDVSITNNDIIDCGGRLLDCYGNRTIIAGNLFKGTQGLYITYISGSNNSFIENHLEDFINPNYIDALRIDGGDYNTISYNYIKGKNSGSDDIIGIDFINSANNNTCVANTIKNFSATTFEGFAVKIYSGSDYNRFISNILINNQNDISDYSGTAYIV